MELSILHHASANDCRSRVAKRFNDYACLQVLVSGEIHLLMDQAKRTIQAPFVWYTYPGPFFEYASTGKAPWHHRYIAFQGSQVDQWMTSNAIFEDGFECGGVTLKWIQEQLDQIAREHQRIDRYSEQLSINLLENLVLKLARERTASTGKTALRDLVIDYVERNNYQPSGYADLAGALGMAESTLRLKFRQEVGMPLHRFTEFQRINRCKALLESSNLPLKEIASEMGYTDVYYFSRHFHKIAGVPPGAYRNLTLRPFQHVEETP